MCNTHARLNTSHASHLLLGFTVVLLPPFLHASPNQLSFCYPSAQGLTVAFLLINRIESKFLKLAWEAFDWLVLPAPNLSNLFSPYFPLQPSGYAYRPAHMACLFPCLLLAFEHIPLLSANSCLSLQDPAQNTLSRKLVVVHSFKFFSSHIPYHIYLWHSLHTAFLGRDVF